MSAVRDLPLLLRAGVADLQADLAAADRTVRAPLALNRRMAVVHLRGGSGASTLAAAVANHIARRRAGAVLAVDAAAGTRSLLWHAGFGTTAAPEPEPRRRTPRSVADAVAGLPVNGAGTVGLDLHTRTVRLGVAEPDWAAAVAPLARFTEVVVTDWGVRPAEGDLGAVAAASQAVCLVCRAERGPLESVLAAAAALSAQRHRPRIVVAAVDIGGTARRSPQDLARGVAVHRIPHEPAHAAAVTAPPGRTAARTRFAVAGLAAALLEQGPVRP